MINKEHWCEQLTSIGLNTFSEKHRTIMAELVSHGIPATYAVLTETAAEAIIEAISAMLVQNIQMLLTDLSIDGCSHQ